MSARTPSITLVRPPIKPMLGKLVRELPRGEFLYEPKWDGFRCLAFVTGSEVELRSRHDRPLARYFPEIVAALREVRAGSFVIDGELLLPAPHGYDFSALMSRLHPATSRIAGLSEVTPARLVAFDLLGVGAQDMRSLPFKERRRELERLQLPPAGTIAVSTATRELGIASRWLERSGSGGIDGVMAKPLGSPYVPGARAMLKVKRERTLDCVVAGLRMLVDRPLPSSLLLGLFDDGGTLRHIGVASSFSEQLRHALALEMRPLVTELGDHPWEHGFLMQGSPIGRLKGAAARWDPAHMSLDWIPLRPQRVVEVSYDHIDQGRLRHPARFRRWRPDRDPRSCTFDQLEGTK